MAEIIRADELANGVRVEFVDGSNRYFGDYHRLRIEVHCRVALTEQLFADATDPAARPGDIGRGIALDAGPGTHGRARGRSCCGSR